MKPNASNQPTMTRRRGLGAILLLFLTFFITPAARSQEAAPVEQLKAAFLYNFVRYVEWPTNAFSSDSAPIIIGVVSKDSDKFADNLSTLLKERKAHNRPVIVKRIRENSEVANCHVVFLADGDGRRVTQIAEATRKKPILLVGEIDDFLENGGMINIVQDEKQKQLRFDIHIKNAEQANLTISSHLLRLARKKIGGAE